MSKKGGRKERKEKKKKKKEWNKAPDSDIYEVKRFFFFPNLFWVLHDKKKTWTENEPENDASHSSKTLENLAEKERKRLWLMESGIE